MLKRYLALLCFFIVANFTWCQTCNIQTPDYICLGDLLAFNYTSSAGVQSASWKFGDGNTSNLSTPFHQYAQTGSFTIELTLSLTGGGTCTQTKNIDVYALPTVSFSVNSVNLCLPRATICLTDNSTPSSSSRPLVKKLILWGDGAADSFNYSGSKKHCYTYTSAALNLPLLIDIRDNKGCRNQDTININVFDGISTLDFHHDVTFLCDSNQLCFCNTSTYDTSLKMKFKWDIEGKLGDDLETSYNAATGKCVKAFCYTQVNNNTVNAKLIYENKFGCKDTLVKPLNYLTYNFTPTYSVNMDTACSGEEFVFTADDNATREHSWNLSKLPIELGKNFGNQFKVKPREAGFWKMKYTAKELSCVKEIYDSIYVRGPKARFNIFNAEQCNVNDTVYFTDVSSTFLNAQLKRLWSFNDPNAPQCTTDSKNGININLNCNYSKDSCAKHYYAVKNCYSPKLYVEDSVHGCKDSLTKPVQRLILEAYNNELLTNRHPNPVYCEYETIRLIKENKDCDWSIVSYFKDSANPNLQWKEFASQFNFADELPFDTSGWVTLGIVRKVGNPLRYIGKGSASVLDTMAICLDTIWLHKFLRVIERPEIVPYIARIEDCKPFKATIKLRKKPEIDIYRYVINWGDGSTTIDTLINEAFPDSFEHVYADGISQNYRFYVESANGCAGLGFGNMRHSTNSSFDYYKGKHVTPLVPLSARTRKVCIGDTITFEDSVYYAGSISSRWRQQNVPEKLVWDFGDGSAFHTGTFPVHHAYYQYGVFEVKMIATDSLGCKDTVLQTVRIPKVTAGLEDTDGKIICGDITRLYDSSSIAFNYLNDSIAKWFWTFGDGKAASVLKDPYRNFPKPGKYQIFHIAENTYGCKDTIESEVNVKGPSAYFEILSDTVACPNHLVTFNNLSSNASNYIWNFGNTSNNILSTNKDTNVQYQYGAPGIYDIYLTAADSIYNPITNDYSYCAVTFPDTSLANAPLRRIRIVPKRKVDFIIPDTVCANIPFELEDFSDPIYQFYNWYLEGDIDSIKVINQKGSYSFSSEGEFVINYRPTYIPQSTFEPVCLDSSSKKINVIGFSVGFKYDYEKECGRYTFMDTSDNTIISYMWNFGHPQSGSGNEVSGKNAFHAYGLDTGSFLVCLAAESRFGCKDTICKTVSNDYLTYVKLFNVFTPNNDGFNDDYDIIIENELLYKIQIFNRYGTQVYTGSNDGSPNDGVNWNGRIANTGDKCAQGTYYYRFEYQLNCTESESKQVVHGVISLLR